MQRAHIVQPVGELDEKNTDILGHGEEELAEIFGLCGAFGDKIKPLSLVSPSTRRPMSLPKSLSISSLVESVSSIVSCKTAATIVASSSFMSVRIAATSRGCEKKGSPDARFAPHAPSWHRHRRD